MYITDEPNDGFDDFDVLQCPNCGGQMEFIPTVDDFGNRIEDGDEGYCCADCGHWEWFHEWDDEDIPF